MGLAGRDQQRHVLILSGLASAVPARIVLRLAWDWDLSVVASERISWTRAELESALTELRAATGLEDLAGSEPGIAPPW